MARRRISILASTAVAFGALAVAPGVQADAAIGCGSGMVCIYPQTNYNGTPYVRRASDGSVNLADTVINDRTFSVRNNSSDAARIYRSHKYDGSHTCIQPGGSIGDLRSYSVGQWGSSMTIKDNSCG